MIRPQTCPICNEPLSVQVTASPYFPFCSERCRNVDLHRWCSGRYAIVEPLARESTESGGEAEDHADDA